MAFSLRKMFSNIKYFKKPGEDGHSSGDSPTEPIEPKVSDMPSSYMPVRTEKINFDQTEPDSTSKHATSLNLPDPVKFTSKKISLSDTDLVKIDVNTRVKKDKRKPKKLKLDIQKANRSMEENLNRTKYDTVENTPNRYLMDCNSANVFSERFNRYDFNKSFDIFDAMSDDESSYEEENIDIESLSDSDISLVSHEGEGTTVKMCRKVDEVQPESDSSNGERQLVPSTTPESFADMEVDKNEEERTTILLNYQMKLEKIECILKKLLSDFQFHIEVSKIFMCRSVMTALPGTDVNNIPKSLGEVAYMDNINRGVSPTGSWNIIMEKEDTSIKKKLKKQLFSIKIAVEQFMNGYLKDEERKKKLTRNRRSITFDLYKGKRFPHKHLRISNKKRNKRFDFPDFREAMLNLFNMEPDNDESSNNITHLVSDLDESETSKCGCRCHMQSPLSQADSGLTSKNNDQSFFVTSSIGNFSLDSSTLSAYSESLDQVVSYNSFQDTSLYSMLFQKATIDRISFYIKVHSIQLKCDSSDMDYESKNTITFHCPACKTAEADENGVIRHILDLLHCENIHFLYKTAYIKRCIQMKKEIQPSTVLNPMKMYRDEDKIVCFGDATYACSLCFEHPIIGESVLMAHCSGPDHVERKERLDEILN